NDRRDDDDDHDGRDWNRTPWATNNHGNNGWDNRNWWWDNDRRGFFKDRRDKMQSWQADVLSDFLTDCVSVGSLRELSWWRLRWLVSTVGLDDDDRGHIHNLKDLSNALGDRVQPRDVRNFKVGEILQVGRACGLSTSEVLDLLLQF